MRTARLSKLIRTLTLPIAAAVTLTSSTALAGGHKHHGWQGAPADIDAAPMPAVHAFPGAFAYQSTTPWCYAVPIQAVYQYPAVLANQPGAEVGYLWTDPAFGILGGQPYLYRP